MINTKKKIINPHNENFSKPAVIISNHQSHADILLMLMLYPKLNLLTNDWVWNSPIFGRIVKFADFYPVSTGIEKSIYKLSEKVKDGYSIVVFPEGSRSETPKIRRFHKGAFYIAEKLKLDILPVILHGTGDCMTKGSSILRSGRFIIKFLERIKLNDRNFGTNYSQRTKLITKYFKQEYQKIRNQYETPAYYKNKLISNYLYKGPVLEWYLKVKLILENSYKLFHKLIPEKGDIVDIGCGYGFMSYMLSFLSDKHVCRSGSEGGRKITGIDYDKNKIEIAENCFSKSENINFVCCNVLEYSFNKSDAFILSDVLHYLPEKQQQQLLIKCIENLNHNGTIVIRERYKDLKKKYRLTKFTEFLSTRFGFNHAKNKPCFTSKAQIIETALKYNMSVEVIDKSKFTSNIFIVLKKV